MEMAPKDTQSTESSHRVKPGTPGATVAPREARAPEHPRPQTRAREGLAGALPRGGQAAGQPVQRRRGVGGPAARGRGGQARD